MRLVQALHIFEEAQESFLITGRTSVRSKIFDDLALPLNTLPSLSDVPFSRFKLSFAGGRRITLAQSGHVGLVLALHILQKGQEFFRWAARIPLRPKLVNESILARDTLQSFTDLPLSHFQFSLTGEHMSTPPAAQQSGLLLSKVAQGRAFHY